MTEKAFNEIVEAKCAELHLRVDDGLIQNAKDADEAAAELAGESCLKPESRNFESLLAILTNEAGKLFPGNWEDYPRT